MKENPDAASPKKTKDYTLKLSLWGLLGVVISAMVGSGVYSLPQNMAKGAGAASIILAWLITGFGMFCIVYTFHLLAKIKPEMASGIYSYSQDGFGPGAGFLTAWGYWLCNICANTGIAVILMEALNYFFPPYFEGGNNLNSLIVSTLILWLFFILVYRGIKTAAAINFIGTCFKLVPIIIFICVCIFAFDFAVFKQDISFTLNSGGFNFKDITAEVKNTMLITIWAFIGVEAAVVLTGRAKRAKDVSRATLGGFFICLICYSLISLLPFGILERGEISKFANPSTAGVLQSVIGKAGGLLMIAGLMVSVLFSWLSWVIIATEIPFSAAQKGLYPKYFLKENARKVPAASLLVTTIATQITLLVAFFSYNAWETMLSVTGVMVLPVYFLTTLYLFKISRKKKFSQTCKVSRPKAVFIGSAGIIYALWLIYAANIKYLAMALAFYVCGIPVYMIARRERKETK